MIADFWFWWMPVMAVVTESISPAAVGTIISGILVALLGGGYLGKKVEENRKVTVDANPHLRIKLEKDFITRREHEGFRAEVRADFIKLEGLVERGAERVDEKHLQLLQTIERVAKTGVDGRVYIWQDLKDQGLKVAALQERTDTGKEIARLIEVLKKEDKK